MARAIETGVLSINSNSSVRVTTPFGGFKQSGVGRELGPDALDHYTEREERLLRDRGGLMAGRLEGKVCVITGAASGIGAESARLFGGEGAHVVGVDLIEGSEGELAIEADVTDEEQVRAHLRARPRASSAASTCSSTTPGSTRATTGPVLETELDAWQRVQDVNLRSVFLCCKHGIPHLLETGGGSVINTASFVAVMGAAVSQISYTASKGAVLALSRELGVEFARRGVRVNALCPGPSTPRCFRSCSPRTPRRPPGASSTCRWAASRSPRRSPRRPLFLASDESSYITASTFLVDGGLSGAYLTPETGE